MRPENDLRRRVIREWMSLPRDKRQSQEQAAAFVTKVVKANPIGPRHGDPHTIVMAWLAPASEKPRPAKGAERHGLLQSPPQAVPNSARVGFEWGATLPFERIPL